MTVAEVSQLGRFSRRVDANFSRMNFAKAFLRADKLLLVVALCISSCAISGCVESSFQSANDSRMPRWVTLPPGLTRTDVSVTLNYYDNPLGRNAKFTLKDSNGKKLAVIKGKVKGLSPLQLRNPPEGFDPGYPAYEVVVAGGVTEIIEHRKMEPIFYVNDDPAIRKAALARRKMK